MDAVQFFSTPPLADVNLIVIGRLDKMYCSAFKHSSNNDHIFSLEGIMHECEDACSIERVM